MAINSSNKINTLSASYIGIVTRMTIDSFSESRQQHVPSTYDVKTAATIATPACCGSSRTFWSHDSVIHQTRRQSSEDSFKPLRTESLGTAKVFSTYDAFTDQTYGQSSYSLFQTRQTDSLRTTNRAYSTSIDHTRGATNGKSTSNSSMSPKRDSLGTIKVTVSASMHPTRGQSTDNLPKTPQTDSARTSKVVSTYSAFVDHGSLVVIDTSEMESSLSSFQNQVRLSTFQVRPSLSSLSTTLTPSVSG